MIILDNAEMNYSLRSTLGAIVPGHVFGRRSIAVSMVGASAILFNLIVQGLAVPPLFDLATPTLLTVPVISGIYVVPRDERLLTVSSKGT